MAQRSSCARAFSDLSFLMLSSFGGTATEGKILGVWFMTLVASWSGNRVGGGIQYATHSLPQEVGWEGKYYATHNIIGVGDGREGGRPTLLPFGLDIKEPEGRPMMVALVATPSSGEWGMSGSGEWRNPSLLLSFPSKAPREKIGARSKIRPRRARAQASLRQWKAPLAEVAVSNLVSLWP